MKKNIFAAVLSIASISAGSSFAAGLDFSGSATQDYSYILDSGNSVSISRTTNSPKISGSHPDGYALTNPFSSFSGTSMSAKWDYNGTMIGISTSSPYVVDLTFSDGIMTNTSAKVTSNETAILASRGMGNGFKVFGGIRINQYKVDHAKPFVGGTANPTFTRAGGYQYELDTGSSTGFSIGAAYEVPQIMLRASIQYNSEIKHNNAKITETLGGATTPSEPTDMISPSSMIVKLRSALSPRMLAFLNWRSSQYLALDVKGPVHTAAGLGSIYDPTSGTDITLGVALKINDQLNALIGTARGQATDDGSPTVNILSPFKGTNTQFIGGSLKVTNNLELNAAYSLTSYGDANAGTLNSAGSPVAAPFTDNKGSRVTIGAKISF